MVRPASPAVPPSPWPRLWDLPDVAATEALARGLAGCARAGDVILLEGDLGAGKSTFARAFIRARAGAEIEVPSPTFTLVQTYPLEPPVWHFDLYRLSCPEEIWELGVEDAFAEGISLIEWPDRLGPHRPAGALVLTLEHAAGGGDARRAILDGPRAWAERLRENPSG